jgi:transposase
MKPPQIVTATRSELEAILVLVEPVLPQPQYQLLQGVLQTLEFLTARLQDAGTSLRRLRRMLFGASSERQRDCVKDSAPSAAAAPAGAAAALVMPDPPAPPILPASPARPDPPPRPVWAAREQPAPPPAPPPRKGHGRMAATAYAGATVIECLHQELRAGQRCPQCESGNIHASPPQVIVKVVGQPPLAATVYRVQRLRCRICDAIFTAPVPAPAAVAAKYDASCASMIALLRYGWGLPSYRLQALQASLQVPLPDATQWDILCQWLPGPRCVHAQMIRQAAQAPLLYNDDTPARVLELTERRKQAEAAVAAGACPGTLKPIAKAIQTSCIVAQWPGHEVVLYFTGHAHAGQNLQQVLAHRAAQLDAPLQMCDALAANTAGDFATVLCHCLAHGRRQVVDVLEQFPQQGRHVLEWLGRVYFHDRQCRELQLDAAARLAHHQAHSRPLMQALKDWIDQRFQQREVEPNSGLGKALKYLLKHWSELTAFLRHAGAPLGRVEMWRGDGRSRHRCFRPFRLAVPYEPDRGSVSTSPSSNRTCATNASGSLPTHQAFAFERSRAAGIRRISLNFS